MLILTRRIGEILLIGPEWEIEVTILGIQGKQVRLGINAPPDWKIDRLELAEKKSMNLEEEK